MFLLQAVVVHCDEGEDPEQETPAEVLKEFDENRDGKLSLDEIMAEIRASTKGDDDDPEVEQMMSKMRRMFTGDK